MTRQFGVRRRTGPVLGLAIVIGLAYALNRSGSVLAAGEAASYSFDEGVGTTVGDSSGNRNTGTITGTGVTWTAQGKFGSALLFNGTGGNVTVPHSPSLNLTSSFTLSAWVKKATQYGTNTVLIKGSDACGYWLQTGDDQVSSGFSTAAGCKDHYTSTANVQPNVWTYLTAVFDDTANTYRIYVNGNQVLSQSETAAPLANVAALVFGQTNFAAGNYERWNGLIDEVRIYNRTLTQAEIQTDMNTPVGSATPPPYDFSLNNGGNVSVVPGTSGTTSVTATLISGVPSAVTFTASGLPAATTASFSSPSCSPTCSTTVTLTTSGSTPLGTSPVTVTGTSGAIVHTTTFNLSVVPVLDTTPPVVSAVTTNSITSSSAVVTWTTDEPATSLVRYGTTSAYGLSTVEDGTLTTTHSQTLTGLGANTTYHFQVSSADASGNRTQSTDFTFTSNPPAAGGVFQNEFIVTGLNLPTCLKFLPDGRMIIGEMEGRIELLMPGATQVESTPFLQLTNVGTGQQALIDIVLDPDFVTNHYYYVFYTRGTPNLDTVSRFTANSSLTTTDPATEMFVYSDDVNSALEHHGGALNFGLDGKLYITTGEHFNAPNAQSLTSFQGKILRINKDGTIPTDNPFYDGPGPNKDAIWALGLRNPYRAYIDPFTGKYYIGDVGGNDKNLSYESLYLGARGVNFGWPLCEFDPCTNPPITPPIYTYPHAGRDSAITGGFVYHGSQYPSEYVGNYFFADYTQNWIKRMTFDANGNIAGVFNFEPPDGSKDGPYGNIVYLTEGPDGAMYYVDIGYDEIANTVVPGAIRRIRYVGPSNLPPTAVASASPVAGQPPLMVMFSSLGSADPEGLPLTYSWTFGDGTTSTAANPAHTFTQSGRYTVRLSVSDGVSSTNATPLTIDVGTKPVINNLTPADGGTFRAGDSIAISGDATDAEDGVLPASAFSWSVDFHHATHIHPGETFVGTKTPTFVVPTSGHDFDSSTYYEIRLTVTDSSGLQTVQSHNIYPTLVTLGFDTAPTGLSVSVDGIPRTTPFTKEALVNFQSSLSAPNQTQGSNQYTFTSWSDAGAQTHTLVVPATGQTYVATYSVTQPAFDFSISNAGNVSVVQGAAGSTGVTATLVSGASAAVSFTASGLPAGTSASFSSPSCSPTCSTTLTLTTSGATPIATSTITVTGTSGALVHTTTLNLTVTASTPPPTGLVAAYGMSEATGTTVGDSSGNGNVGTITGTGVTWTAQGRYGSALSFNGTNGNVTIPHSASLNLSSSFTLSAWVKKATQYGTNTILIKGIDACGYWMQTGDDQVSTGFSDGVSGCKDHFTSTANLQPNVWTYLTAVFDDAGNTYRVYVNGTQVLSQNETGVPLTNAAALVLGQTDYAPGNYERWNGLMDEIRIYNRALTQAEIQTDMNTPIGGVTPPSFDFSLINGGNVSVVQGSAITNSITATLVSGTAAAVTWTASGLPTGTTASFSPTSCTPTCSTTVTLTTSGTTPIATTTITVTGTSGTVVHTTTFNLTVTPVPFDFSLTNGGNKSVVRGSAVTNSVTATLVSGTAAAVTWTGSGLPTGTTASFSPTSCTPTCTTTVTLTTSGTTPLATSTITVTGTSGTLVHSTTFNLTVTPPFDFSVANGGDVSVLQGAAVSNTVTATLVSGTTAAVTWSASGLPAGTTASFSPTSCTATCSTAMTLTTSSTTPIATSTITVTGTSGTLAHTTTFALTVTSVPPSFDFSLINGGNVSVVQGSAVTNSVTATLVSGTAANVTFTASGLPTGTTGSFSPTSCTPTCSTTVTLTTSGTTPIATTTITVTGTSGTVVHTTTFNLTVTPVPFDFSLTNGGNKSVVRGSAVTNSVTATLVSGTAAAVTWTASGLPTGTTASFSPTSCTPTCSTTVTLTTSGTTPLATSTITVTGTSGTLVHSTTFNLTVTAPFDFSMSNGGNKSVARGSAVTNSVTATLVSGTAANVTFTASGLPTGTTGSFSPTSCTPTCSTTLTLTTSGTTPLATSTITVTGTSGTLVRTTTFSLTVTAAFDFSMSNGGNKSVVRASSVTNSVTATLVSGTAASVAFSASGLPTGTTASFSPTSCTPTCSTTLTLTTSGTTPLATSTITVTGTSGTLSRTTTFNLTVTAPFDFSVSTGGNVSAAQGGVATNTVTATLVSGTAAGVTWTASGLPTGATASFSPTSCTPTCSDTLTLTISGTTPLGTSTITVTGTSGTLVRTATFTLTVSTSPPPPSGLVAAYGMGEGAGTMVGDNSGNGNTGTVTGTGVTWTTQGKYGAALSFNGTGGNVTIPHSASLNLTSSFTLSAWVKKATDYGTNTILMKAIDACGYWLATGDDQVSSGFNDGVTGCKDHFTSSANIPTNTWTYITAVFDDVANTYKVYVNGTEVLSQTESRAPLSFAAALVLGQTDYAPGNYERWNGLMDEIRIYNRPLTPAEIQTDMNTPLGGGQ